MRRIQVRLVCAALVGGLAVLIGCGSRSVDDEVESCSSDADCAANETCEPLPAAKLRAAVAPPCMINYTPCSSDANCPAELLCWPTVRVGQVSTLPHCAPTQNVCGPKCPDTPCYEDEVCEADGHCRVTSCDEADAPACPEHWICNPEGAAFEDDSASRGALDDSPNFSRDILRGCTRLRCDEQNGLTCRDNWACDAENAADASGCVPRDCKESGHCSDDTGFICTPTSSAEARTESPDVHGCLYRLCDEGFACLEHQKCDVGSPSTDVHGCRMRNCEEGYDCGFERVCAPSLPGANPQGCVHQEQLGTGGTGAGGSAGAATGGSAGAATGGSVAQGGSFAQGGSSTAGRAGSGGTNTSGTGGATLGSGGSSDPGEEPVGRCVAH